MNKLPDKPSELIRLALHDLAACEQDPLYVINMGDWHRMSLVIPLDTCAVCVAGAVMAKTLKAIWGVQTTPSSFCFDYDTDNKLNAINQFRLGLIAVGLCYMKITKPNVVPVYMNVYNYNMDPTQFRCDIENVIRMFETHGL